MKPKNKPHRTERFTPVKQVKVHIWGRYVGAVAWDSKLECYVFAYDPRFGRSGIQLAPLHMPADASSRTFQFPSLPEETYRRLPAMLADALPDDFGNALIDKYMAEHGIAKSEITAMDRLAYMGKRAMGALEFQPIRGPKSQKPTALKLGNLVTIAREVVKGSLRTDTEAEAALRSIIEVGTSANGARAKAVIGWNRSTKKIRSGQAGLPPGFEHWLLKFDGMGDDRELGVSQEYGRIEFAYYLMAKAAGIDMPECDLLEENGRAHFMSKRFDRDRNGSKHHLQSLCAMDHLDFRKKGVNSYEQLFMVIRQLRLGHGSMAEAYRRMVFNVLARNCDDHTKNFSFLLRDGGSWELAPAYDVTFAHNPKGLWTYQHLMSVNGKFKGHKLQDFMSVADLFGIGEAPSIISEVRSSVKRWAIYAKKAGISAAMIRKIGQLHITV